MMKQYNKKSVFVFLVVSVVCIGLLPSLNYFKNPDKTKAEDLFKTDILESYINYVLFKFFHKSTNPENVIVGKNGDLFLGNNHNKLLYKTIGVYPFSKQQIENWASNLLQLQQSYESRGIDFIFVITPNKHTIYSENLPNWIKPQKHNLTDTLVENALEKGIKLVDLRPHLILEKEKSENRLYWKSDSHWNQLGASISFKEIIKRINEHFNSNLLIPQFIVESRTIPPNGGNARFLKLLNLLPDDFETAFSTVIKGENEVCVGDIDKDTHQMSDCQMKWRPYLDIHQGPQYSLNHQALNNKKVLLLCDSFVMQIANLYNKTFSTVWKQKYNHLFGDELDNFIGIHQPELVIYQVVERSIFNNYFIDINAVTTKD